MTEYVAIDRAKVGSPTDAPTYAKAPRVTQMFYDEAMPMLFASSLVYEFTSLVNMAQDKSIDIKLPEGFPDLSKFMTESLDLREENGGNGLSFDQMSQLLEFNKETISEGVPEYTFGAEVVAKIARSLRQSDGTNLGKNIFLATHRAIQQDIACVYSVVKDCNTKQIIVTFRGSQGTPFSTRDWQTNVNARLETLRTPKQIRDKMPKGIKQKRVLVHKGFHDYLFDNDRVEDGHQRYDKIIDDIKPLMEEGFSLYITGHSLGGALATMFSFKIAGAGESKNWIPRPVTCITYAAPFSGTKGYRTATELMEQEGLLRSLRVNNAQDIVPSLPFLSLFRKRLMKHTGLNLRLWDGGHRLQHSSAANFLTALRNSIFKPVWKLTKWHSLPLHEKRMVDEKKKFSQMTLDDLYNDTSYVSKNFLDGKK